LAPGLAAIPPKGQRCGIFPHSPPGAFEAPPSLVAPSSLLSPVGAAPFGSRGPGLLARSSLVGPVGAGGLRLAGPRPPRSFLARRGPLARGVARSLPAYRGWLREHASHPAGL